MSDISGLSERKSPGRVGSDKKDEDRLRVRESFRRAAPGEPHDLRRLIDAVPAMMNEADRRRRLAVAPGAPITAVARWWLPRLAAATALLVLAGSIWSGSSLHEGSSAKDDIRVLDEWLATGNAPSDVEDPVLGALAG